MNTENRILSVLAAYTGEGYREIDVFYNQGVWSIHVGNKCASVGLGEAYGEHVFTDPSLEKCLMKVEAFYSLISDIKSSASGSI